MSFLARLTHARDVWESEMYIEKMNGGRAYAVWCMEMEINMTPPYVRIPRPNRYGLYLLTFVADANFLFDLARFVVTGHEPFFMTE